ncbi:hypothetical protein [Streptosporangium pseudovulgare]|uniref:Lipoprotein n=1 Tax=Streptosporangium pseudovulgare TaxID=35765 RepID=A0ABQ2RFF2_9ACTN|nr:hypothetical protein [Streptosporangium pseudovulgare]GGQ26280.1 hypothetical protein GCM10010140_65570 [Streptosporangium pseudovulgare]
MPRRSLAALAVLCALAGCGTSPSARSATPSAPPDDTARRIQSVLADCMKGEGFTYVPFVPPPPSLPEGMQKAAGGDYAAMKAERSKTGFGVFSTLVYPHDFTDIGEPGADPNWKIQRDLSPAQQKAYDKAETSCQGRAITKVTGKVVRSEEDRFTQLNQVIDQTVRRELDGDPALAELASAMSGCLSRQGYKVTSAKPTDMALRGERAFTAQKDEVAKNDDIPDTDLPEGKYYDPTHLSASEARRHLDQEIKAALDDLECGKDFYPAYLPKFHEIVRRVQGEFGVS